MDCSIDEAPKALLVATPVIQTYLLAATHVVLMAVFLDCIIDEALKAFQFGCDLFLQTATP